MTYFIFCIHNHQPAGNFDYVLEHAYSKAYEPMLKRLHEKPFFKFSFHISGFLLDWLCQNRPGYVELLKAMVKRGQVEIMGGGYYEPILSVIPPDDRSGQIQMMNEKIEELFGVRPRGIWLAERVWDPTLPYYLKEAGVEYVVVDDYHFVKSGLKKDNLFGYYITEDLGREVKVFAGSERLRYLIPFEPVERFEQYLREVDRNSGGARAAIFADDGEKFGIWPGTDRSVYEEGWIDNFLGKIEDSREWLVPVTFSEYIDKEEPLGRVYLTTTSYMEMGEWALFADASGEYGALRKEIKSWRDGERILRFFQGGTWRNFLAKYPEADWMHKRMIMVSEAVKEAKDKGKNNYRQARKHLYMAQCNDAYWHGVFGGLYLPHLRANVYENLVKARTLVDDTEEGEVVAKACDMDADTHQEVIMSTAELDLFFSTRRGGSLVEMDWKKGAANLTNTLSRWYEGYHKKLKKASSEGAEASKSIHDMVLTKEDGLERYLKFDSVQRTSLREHFLAADETLERFSANEHVELGDFYNGIYSARINGNRLILARNGMVKQTPLTIEKEVALPSGNSFSVNYRLRSPGESFRQGDSSHVMFGVEFNLCLPGCNGPDCYYQFKEKRDHIGAEGVVKGISSLSVVDGFSSIKISFSFDSPVNLWRYPITTVSLSEAGFEKNYQGSSLVFLFPVSFPVKDPVNFRFTVKIEQGV